MKQKTRSAAALLGMSLLTGGGIAVAAVTGFGQPAPTQTTSAVAPASDAPLSAAVQELLGRSQALHGRLVSTRHELRVLDHRLHQQRALAKQLAAAPVQAAPPAPPQVSTGTPPSVHTSTRASGTTSAAPNVHTTTRASGTTSAAPNVHTTTRASGTTSAAPNVHTTTRASGTTSAAPNVHTTTRASGTTSAAPNVHTTTRASGAGAPKVHATTGASTGTGGEKEDGGD